MKASHSTSMPRPGEVVIFRPEFIEFGGEERVILALSRKLHELRKPHSVACYFDTIGLASFADMPLEVHQLLPKRNLFSKAMALRRYLGKLRATNSPTPVLFSIQSACHAGISVATPYHLWIPDTYSLLSERFSNARFFHSPIRWLRNQLLHFYTGRGMRRAQTLVTNTKVLCDEMEDLYGRTAEVIYLGGFGGPLPIRPSRTTAPIQILSVSRLQQSKRIDWIFRALAGTHNLPAWTLNIVGKGPEYSRLSELADSLKLGNNVIFHGFVDDAKLRELYGSSHIFAMPAIQGYGLPAIEALYQYLAVVMSSDSGVAEILGDTPWVAISKGGEVQFAEALLQKIRQVSDPMFFEQAFPALPTEDQWADSYARTCGW